jgi:hypothetical protein
LGSTQSRPNKMINGAEQPSFPGTLSVVVIEVEVDDKQL